MKKRTLFKIIIGAVLAMSLGGAAQADDVLAKVKAAGVMKVGTETEFAPFDYIDAGAHVGLDDVGELFAVVETVVVEEGERARQPAHPAAELRRLLEENRGETQFAQCRRHVHAGHTTAKDQYRVVHLATLPTALSCTAVPASVS